ncbi:hypothetical protein EVAR_96493_1 [Eumeta japonica]|uniref:Secreted protein n=1 Tax=Eumeta variegata TaxID=151549 RepID=A0A4C1ZWR7_EUMVA|nr:hypothetical protein EVAR_96493_1 [Eumeta japonica]
MRSITLCSAVCVCVCVCACVCVCGQLAIHVAGVLISVRSRHDDAMTIQTSSLTSTSVTFALFFFCSEFNCVSGSLRDGFRRRCRRRTTYQRARIIVHAHTGMRSGNRRGRSEPGCARRLPPRYG